MASVKLNVSLDSETVDILRRRAAELQRPVSRYLAELIHQDARRQQDELAAEGYRLLAADTRSFAEAAWPMTAAVWPAWEGEASQAVEGT